MSSSERNQATMPRCPACGQAGQPVKRATLESLLRSEQRRRISDVPYFVCTTPACDGVYFGSGDATPFGKADLRVRFGLKETAPPRLVCYCFQHTIEEIEDEVRCTGQSTVVERIKVDMKGPGCRCESTNPLGACCLKSVRDIAAEALRRTGREPAVAGTVDGVDEDCCSDNRRDRSGALAAGGSVVAAALSSACCWLPLLLVAFGASAAGIAGFFEAYRPYLLVVAIGLLSLGFYRVYFRREPCGNGASCATGTRKLRIVNQTMLWTTAALVAAFVFFPNYVGALVGGNQPAVTDNGRLVADEYRIEGMTCEGCAATLQKSLASLPNVVVADVDYESGSAVVRHEPDKPVPTRRVIEAARKAGFAAVVERNSR